MKVRIFSANIRKAVSVLRDPSERWRVHLFVEKRKIRASAPLPKASKEEVDLVALERLSRSRSEALELLVKKLKRAGRGPEARDLLVSAMSSYKDTTAENFFAIATLSYREGLGWLGDAALLEAKQLNPDLGQVYQLEARICSSRGNVYQAISSGQRALNLSSPTDHPVWQRFLGEHNYRAGKYPEAVAHFSQGESLDMHWKLRYQFSNALEKIGETLRAEEEMKKCEALVAHKVVNSDAKRIYLHLQNEHHELACRESVGPQASLQARRMRARAQIFHGDFVGLAREVLPCNQDLILAEARALGLELAGRLSEALHEYQAIGSSWRPMGRAGRIAHRLSRVAYRLGKYEVSASAERELSGPIELLSGLDPELDPAFPAIVKAASKAIERREDARAIELLRRLCASSSSLSNLTLLYRVVGNLLADSGDSEGAARAYFLANPSRLPYAAETNAKSAVLSLTERYSDIWETTAVDKEVVLYESFHGMKTACNPLAICLELLRDPTKAHLRHVWAIRKGAPIHRSLLNHPRISFVEYGSVGYSIHLATAGYLINNTSFPRWFVRREAQRYVNTWHGVPWKRLGRDTSDDPFGYDNISRNFLQATDVLVSDEHTAETLVSCNDISSLLNYQPKMIGAPRVDLTLNLSSEDRADLTKRLGIQNGKRIVFYAPTWRGTVGAVADGSNQDLAVIEALSLLDAQVVVRVHHFVASSLTKKVLPTNVVIAPDDIDTNELLGLADILVSDYSSLIFDFAATSRPIFKLIPDYEDYRAARGLYFEIDEVPGQECRTVSELVSNIQLQLESPAERMDYGSANSTFWAREDGASSRRAVASLFGPLVSTRDNKTRVLISVDSLSPTGITQSLRTLLSKVSTPQTHLQLLLPRSIFSNPAALALSSELRESVDFSFKNRLITGTKQERFVWRKLSLLKGAFPAELMGWLRSYMAREYRLLFAETKFDSVIDFDGYSTRSAALLGLGAPSETPRVYVAHSQFRQEMELKYPGHRRIATVLNSFTTVASVSDVALEANREDLHQICEVPRSMHAVLPNIVDVDGLIRLSQESIDSDIAGWFERPGPHLVLVGRLSPEKNHIAALNGLARLHKSGIAPRLLFIGSGPMQHEIVERVNALGLQDIVFIAGQRSNPYPAISRADGLILPSTHEGQGLVLIEAMVLGTPVAATNIPGPASILRDASLGLLVPPTEKGIETALRELSSGNVAQAIFDGEGYEEDALQRAREVMRVS